MKPFLKINFVDFWPSLDKTNNYIFRILSRYFNLEISDSPDVLFYSVYGKKHLSYVCLKILYCAENIRPDFTGCDYALTYDFNKNPKHFRWPLYAHHIYAENASAALVQKRNEQDCKTILANKKKFCCMVVSNPYAKERIEFFKLLNKYKKVDSGGKVLNNIGEPVNNKLAFLSNYKFVISFENESYPGYTSEKIIHPFIVNSIPIYWGNPLIYKDFNKNAFVNVTNNFSTAVEQIIAIDKNDDLFIKMLQEPAFNNNIIPNCCNEEMVGAFLQKAILSRNEIKKVSNNLALKYFHFFNLKIHFFNKKIKRITRNF